ncbi:MULTISPECIES: hypothetical protein [Marinobacter]|uniref:hypothetical protein n=1 Tax=Marinobacter TaxID=2742 RepID=UPI0020066008|nr:MULTISPECIES: hypothetical protein [Marinobacter]MCK7550878.1 hypothetical protein [Marinobacter goseongensis]MDV3502877.1 hypothetical protein [Marinobacter sp. M-5]
MENEDDPVSAGTAPPAKIRKAGCGIRYDEGEIEGIDFSRAAELKPDAPATDVSADIGKDRQDDGHPKPA